MKKQFYFKQVKYKYAVKCKNTSILNKLNISTQFKWKNSSILNKLNISTQLNVKTLLF